MQDSFDQAGSNILELKTRQINVLMNGKIFVLPLFNGFAGTGDVRRRLSYLPAVGDDHLQNL